MNNPMAGRTKSVQNYISATYPDGHVETLFTPLAPYDTPQALDRICEEYNRVIGNMEVEPPWLQLPIFQFPMTFFASIRSMMEMDEWAVCLQHFLLYRNGFYVGKYISIGS